MNKTNDNAVLCINTPVEVQLVGYTKDGTPIITNVNSKTDVYKLGSYVCIGIIFGLCIYIIDKLGILPNIKRGAVKLLQAIYNSNELPESNKLEALVHATNSFIDNSENI